jgi:PAS domain S-box-containing protein
MNSSFQLPKLHILFAEDVSTDREMVERLLRQHKINFVSQCVDTEDEFIRMLDEFKPDIILSDYRMPTFDGMKALKITMQRSPDTPFIILTGSINEDIAVECMRNGADDYIIKQNLKRLIPSIISAMEKKTLKKSEVDALRQLKSSDKKYRMLIEQSIDAIFMVFRGKMIYINQNFQRLFGVTLEEMNRPGFHFSQLLSPASFSEVEKKLEPGIKFPGSSIAFETKLEFASGRQLDAEIAFSSFEYNDEVAFQGVIHDITARKKILNELREAKEKAEESDRLKSAFLATMSHELRTPLNQIIGFSSIIPQITDDVTVVDFASHIHRSGNDLLALIEDLFQMAMVEDTPVVLRRNKVKIGDIFQQLKNSLVEMVHFAGKSDAIQLNFKLDNALFDTEIITDKPKMIQALTQILKNAVKFTKQGSISLSIDFSPAQLLTVRVADTGIGISDHKLEIIFDFFRQADQSLTREYGGVGIGLALSKKIAEAMNAHISVETEVDKGSTFMVEFPVENGTPDLSLF